MQNSYSFSNISIGTSPNPHSALSHVSLLFLQASDATQVASKSSPGVSRQQTNLSNIFASKTLHWSIGINIFCAIKKSVIGNTILERRLQIFILLYPKNIFEISNNIRRNISKMIECRLQMFPISMFNILSLAARPKFKGYFISNYKGTHATFECNN